MFLIAACSNDSSLNSSDDTISNLPESSKISYTATGTYSIDKSKQLLITSSDNTEQSACIDDGNKYTWKSVPLRKKPTTAKYEFHGDTLILFVKNTDTDRVSSSGNIYTGGKAGEIEGTWSVTNCTFFSEGNKTSCSNDDKYNSHTYTFSKGKLYSTDNFYMSDYLAENSDFMNSSFMETLYDFLDNPRQSLHLTNVKDIFDIDSSRVQAAIDEFNVDIKQKTKTSEVFELNGKSFTVNIKKVEITPDSSRHNPMFLNKEILMEITDGNTTCELNYVEKSVNKNLCKSENAEFLRTQDILIDNEGNELDVADLYQSQNVIEFEECLKDIVQKDSDN